MNSQKAVTGIIPVIPEKDSWSELEALEIETKRLLESIKGKPKNRNNNNQVDKKQKSTKEEPSKPKKKKKLDVNITENLNRSEVFDSDKFKKFLPDGRSTVEILDDASPEGTPRQVDKVKEAETALRRVKLRELMGFEEPFRDMAFGNEKLRVTGKADTFVPYKAGVTVSDVDNELNRLMKIEDSARRIRKVQILDVEKRSKYLLQDRLAIKIQAAYRGRIGRKRFALKKKLQQISTENEELGNWIQVSDPKSGDSWYFNRVTNQSQWEIPKNMKEKSSNKKSKLSNPAKEKLPTIGGKSNDSAVKVKDASPVPKSKLTTDGNTAKKALLSMSLPSLDGFNISKQTNVSHSNNNTTEVEARREVEDILGIHKITKPDSLFAPDGYFKPQLRVTVQDALLETRFDSVSTVLADNRWFEGDENKFATKAARVAALAAAGITDGLHDTVPGKETKIDHSRPPLVSTIVFNKKKSKVGKRLETTDASQGQVTIASTKDLTFKDVEHPGFVDPSAVDSSLLCFGCWSAGGNRKCVIHEDGGVKLKTSQTMLLCRNWDLSVMQRRYRSEEMQEIFSKSEKTLRFDAKRKTFSTIVEQKHPVYRLVNRTVDSFNGRHFIFGRVKRWLRSVFHQVRAGKVRQRGKFGAEYVKLLRAEMSSIAHAKVVRYTIIQRARLTIPPITGYSWPERQGRAQYLFRHVDKTHGEEVDLINVYPTPVPLKLYEPREYHPGLPRSIPMPKPSYSGDVAILPANHFISESHSGAWFERLCGAVVRDCLSSAKMQIQAITPMTPVDIVQRTKRPAPNTISFATIAQKPALNNLAVGGLSTELLVYQLITTFLPPQYGNFMVMDKSIISPGVTVEATISFESIAVPPVVQFYIRRPLEHPLNYRRAPTITANSSVQPDNLHYYGKNKPEQTGEQESHGFRTTAWAPCLLSNSETDPQTFVPGNTIVSLNTPKANTSVTTHADDTYPFCEPSSRDNSTLDFYHLLLTGVNSLSKAQVFTVLTCQEQGKFLKDYRRDLPMGHVVIAVYRSWAFVQRETIQEFKTDDGVSYWYHRKTGQTFWERPLYEPEEDSPLDGGTLLDMDHPEEPNTVTKGVEGAKRRYLQGDFRKQMMFGIERKPEAIRRRIAAAATVQAARERGAIPEPSSTARNTVVTNHSSLIDQHSNAGASRQGNHAASAGAPRDAVVTRSGVNAKTKDQPLNEWQIKMIHQNDEIRNASESSSIQSAIMNANNSHHHNDNTNNNFLSSAGSTTTGGAATSLNAMSGGLGIDANMMMALSQSLTQMLGNMTNMDQTNPHNMIQLGLGMGMALLGTGAVQGVVDRQTDNARVEENGMMGTTYSMLETAPSAGHALGTAGTTTIQQDLLDRQGAGFFPSVDAESIEIPATPDIDPFDISKPRHEPIGLAKPNVIISADKPLDHREESGQVQSALVKSTMPLNSLEVARNLQLQAVVPTDTPDAIPQKQLTHTFPANAEDAVKNIVPIMAYPELSTHANGGNGAPATYGMQVPAGQGVSFVTKEEAAKQLMVQETELKLRRTVMPLPVGFFESIVAKHVAQQSADYLPQVPNLPQSRTIGRVRPRSAASDWLAIAFDPWSAGKNPLNTEFVPSILEKAEKILKGQAKAVDSMEVMRQKALGDSFINLEDTAGLAQQRNEISKAEILARDFKKLCSLCRHGKFADAEQLMNQADWNVPIDYQDDQGNALLHVVAQNGNKRIMKLCLRRGALINIQNLSGQTALHFAFGFGYTDAGNYLLSKGADDSIRNSDGLTCYEGMMARELALL